MVTSLHQLVAEALEAAKTRGFSQKDLAQASAIGEVALSRLKKAHDARLSTLTELGKVLGKKLIWVDDNTDIQTLVSRGELF